MNIRISEDGTHTIYGPYRDGDKPEFSADPVSATVSFDICEYRVRHSKLHHLDFSDVACYNTPTGEEPILCVVTTEGKVGDHIENLYFTFPNDMYAPAKSDVDDEVNHPKHYTGRKADLECIMFTELMPSLAANAFKYVWRCDDKGNRTEDLEKARWYLNRANHMYYGEAVQGRKVRRLMLNVLNGSDFDDWHKHVLSAIIDGEYSNAYNAISAMIGKPECPVDTSLL